MTTSKTTTDPLLSAVRWTARISSIIVTGIFLLMFLGEGFNPATITPREWVGLFFFPFGLIIGAILGWWKEGLGGAIMLVSIFASFLVMDVSGPGGAYMLICASPGFLFLLSWFLSKTTVMPEYPVHEEDIAQALAPLSSDTEILKTRQARISVGLCPKCGAELKPNDQNCPSCRINLAFARAHLDQW